MAKVITAAGSTIGAEAAAAVVDLGGNAVDAAIAAVVVSMCTEPGINAPAAGAFITVWPPNGDPGTIDGYCEMPGRADPDRLGMGRQEVYMTYGGGMHTNVGYSSVATPGSFAGFDVAAGPAVRGSCRSLWLTWQISLKSLRLRRLRVERLP